MRVSSISTVTRLSAVAALALLAGCASVTRTAYDRQPLDVPDAYRSASEGGAVVSEDPWWDAFRDDQLSGMIEQAITTNTDVQAASVRVRRARLQAGLAENALWVPDFSASVSAGTSGPLKGEEWDESYGASLGVSYTVDLWGEGQHKLDASTWEAFATSADLDGVRLSIATTTATLYWQIVYLDERIKLSSESIAYAQRTLDLTNTRLDAGAVSTLDVLQAERNLASQKASHALILKQRSETANALSILFDQPPQPVEPSSRELPTDALPPVEAGMPADLLLNRPDLRAEEYRLRATLAGVDATRASYLPSLTLSGSISTVADTIADILSNPAGSIAARVALPFLNWESMKLNIKISESEYEEAVISFRQTLYSAIAQVEDALASRDAYIEQQAQLTSAVDRAIRAEELYEARYQEGAESIQPWIDAQETRRSAERSLLEVRLNLLLSMIDTYEAIGGNALPAQTLTSAGDGPNDAGS